MTKYKQAFDKIEPNEEKKQDFLSKTIQYKNAAQMNGETKSKKRFAWTTKRIAAAASTAAVLIFCAIFIPFMLNGGYGGNKDKAIKDHYEEYSFELPFEHTVGNNQHTTLYFKTELTMEQMCESINESGYKASLYDFENIKRIFITITKNEFAYYFVIYDKSYLEPIHGNKSSYTLSSCSASLNLSANSKDPYIYVFLFPNQYAGIDIRADVQQTIKIYCAFDEFAEFYSSTGKNDAQIDYENKTVTFFCEGNADNNWIRGNVLLKYVESENANYINIQPK